MQIIASGHAAACDNDIIFSFKFTLNDLKAFVSDITTVHQRTRLLPSSFLHTPSASGYFLYLYTMLFRAISRQLPRASQTLSQQVVNRIQSRSIILLTEKKVLNDPPCLCENVTG